MRRAIPPLPQTIASEVPAAPAGENGGSNAPPPQESYPLKAAGERQKKDELPVNASLLTMLVLAISSLGGSVLWLLREPPHSRPHTAHEVVAEIGTLW
jgi:hypothetical protein